MANEKPRLALEEAVVRRGTVVWHDGGRARDERIHTGPGGKVKLPGDEVKRLRKLGVLHDPQAAEIPVGLGPNFNIDGGVQVGPTGEGTAPADKAE